jgi:alpha-N-arabinofuranosidase
MVANAQTVPPSLLRDAGFELSPFVNGWVVDSSVASKGTAYRSTTAVHSGHFSLEVVPNATNTGENRLQLFAAVQFFPVASLRGKPLYFSGYLWARDGATAVLRVWTVGASVVELREVRQASGAANPVLLRDVMDVPVDESVFAIAVACSVEGTTGAAYFDDVTLTQATPDYVSRISAPSTDGQVYASATVSPDKILRTIPRTLYGMNVEWGWDAQGAWNEENQVLTPGVVDLMRDMGLTELRFPGGILSDLYHWRDGIGPFAQRPGPVRMPGGSVSSNAFGTDEAFQLADAAGANLMITVNLLSGTPEEAADWVRYVKASGHNVPSWEIGNELYLDFTQFDPPAENWTAERYAETFLTYAKAMREVDPSLRLGAGLEFTFSPSAFRIHPGWEETVLKAAGPQIDFVAVHNGFAPVLPIEDAGWDARTVYSSLFAAPILIKQSLDNLSDIIARSAGPDAAHIQIGVTEWGPGFKIESDSRWVDHLKTLGSAIYAADVMKAFLDTPRVSSAHAFKLSDGSTQGWIGIRENAYIAKPVALALQMFTKHFGSRMVASTVTVPGYESRSLGLVDAVKNVPYLDLLCSLDESGENLYVMAINKHFDRDIQTSIDLGKYEATGVAKVWTLNGTGVDANPGTELPTYTTWAQQTGFEPASRIDMGGPGEVTIAPDEIAFSGSYIGYQFPAHSVTSLVIPIRALGPCVSTPDDLVQAGSGCTGGK